MACHFFSNYTSFKLRTAKHCLAKLSKAVQNRAFLNLIFLCRPLLFCKNPLSRNRKLAVFSHRRKSSLRNTLKSSFNWFSEHKVFTFHFLTVECVCASSAGCQFKIIKTNQIWKKLVKHRMIRKSQKKRFQTRYWIQIKRTIGLFFLLVGRFPNWSSMACNAKMMDCTNARRATREDNFSSPVTFRWAAGF